MTGTVAATLLDRFAYPRLAVVIALGVGLLVLAGALYLVGPVFGSGLRTFGLQLAVIGYLVLLVGASGRIAFAVFNRAK